MFEGLDLVLRRVYARRTRIHVPTRHIYYVAEIVIATKAFESLVRVLRQSATATTTSFTANTILPGATTATASAATARIGIAVITSVVVTLIAVAAVVDFNGFR